MKKGFTLAEVLITLGIIGVVAAITIPTLIANYQKKVYYNQFKKAVNKLENALQMYEYDHDCIGDLSVCGRDSNNWNVHSYLDIDNFIEDISKYFNIATMINKNNYNDICSAYDEKGIKEGYGTTKIYDFVDGNICSSGFINNNTTAFITTDGILYTFGRDEGPAGGNWMDINGPNKGPNAIGRDIYLFYIQKNIIWGGNPDLFNDPCEPGYSDGCATKLLQEGKMNY